MILTEALGKLGQANFFDKQKTDWTKEENMQANRMLQCLNFVLNELESYHFILEKAETILIDGNFFEYSKLSENPTKIKSLRMGDMDIKYEILPSKIVTNKMGQATITYNYISKPKTIEDEILDIRFSKNMMIDGVLAEYLFCEGVYDLAKFYDKRFRNSIRQSKIQKNRMLPKRRWF